MGPLDDGGLHGRLDRLRRSHRHAACAARLSNWKIFNLLARTYQELFRCTPLLVQLLWFYYAFPLLIGVDMDNRVAAMLTLSLYVGAFYAEIFRGRILSIDKGQREAAAAIGMSPAQST